MATPRTARSLGLSAVLIWTLSSCGIVGGGEDCPGITPPAVLVQVEDSLTGEPLGGATGWISDGAEEFPLSGSGDTLRGGSQAGSYTVRVELSGYTVWEEVGVSVRSGECGVHTERLTARLQPQPG